MDHKLFSHRMEGLGQWSLGYSQAVILEAQLLVRLSGMQEAGSPSYTARSCIVGRNTQTWAGAYHKEVVNIAKIPLHSLLRKPQGVHISLS